MREVTFRELWSGETSVVEWRSDHGGITLPGKVLPATEASEYKAQLMNNGYALQRTRPPYEVTFRLYEDGEEWLQGVT